MELKEFISETIKQITDGLIESHDYIRANSIGAEGINASYRTIKFDVGVQTNEGTKGEIGGKIKIAEIFQFGASSENLADSIKTNRIQFDVVIHINHNDTI